MIEYKITDKNVTYNAETDHYYIELDKIRLVIENGNVVGWYDPNQGCFEKDGVE